MIVHSLFFSYGLNHETWKVIIIHFFKGSKLFLLCNALWLTIKLNDLTVLFGSFGYISSILCFGKCHLSICRSSFFLLFLSLFACFYFHKIVLFTVLCVVADRLEALFAIEINTELSLTCKDDSLLQEILCIMLN